MKKSKKLLISDVLHYAADHCLISKRPVKRHKHKFSCCAMIESYDFHRRAGYQNFTLGDVFEGLENMGCDTYSNTLFRKHGDPLYPEETEESVQGMRYMWLKWAALMAEEQGV